MQVLPIIANPEADRQWQLYFKPDWWMTDKRNQVLFTGKVSSETMWDNCLATLWLVADFWVSLGTDVIIKDFLLAWPITITNFVDGNFDKLVFAEEVFVSYLFQNVTNNTKIHKKEILKMLT